MCVGEAGHEGSVGVVAADGAVGCGDGAVVESDACEEVCEECGLGLSEWGEDGGVAECGLDDGESSLGDGAGLVAEEDAEAAGGLESVEFADEDVVSDHLEALESLEDGAEHGETLWYGADDDGDGDGDGVDGEPEPVGPVGRRLAGEGGDEEDDEGDGGGAAVAEDGDLAGESGELELERRQARLSLGLEGGLAEEGLVADDPDEEEAFAAGDDGAAVDAGRAEEVLSVEGLIGAVGGGFGRLVGLAVEGGLVDLECAVHEESVGGDAVAGLEDDEVADDDGVGLEFLGVSVADDLGGLGCGGGPSEGGGLALLSALEDGGDAVGDEDGDEDAEGLVPFGAAAEEEGELDEEGDEQDEEHRVAEAEQEPSPEWRRGKIGEGVAAVCLSAL